MSFLCEPTHARISLDEALTQSEPSAGVEFSPDLLVATRRAIARSTHAASAQTAPAYRRCHDCSPFCRIMSVDVMAG
jgi:hypothetical protein